MNTLFFRPLSDVVLKMRVLCALMMALVVLMPAHAQEGIHPNILQNTTIDATQDPTPAPVPTATAPYSKKIQTRYDYAAHRDSEWLLPLAVYDDGSNTYIRYQQGTSVPAVFGRMSLRGEDYVLNAVLQNDTVLKIQGVHPYLVLRYGDFVAALRR